MAVSSEDPAQAIGGQNGKKHRSKAAKTQHP
jgi:hypothetical protein